MNNQPDTAETENEPILVPVWNIETLRDKVEKMNRRAAKLGCAPLVLTVDPTVVAVKRQVGQDDDGRPVEKVIPSRACMVTGTMPKLNGWTLVASIQLIDGITLIRTVPGCSCPAQYRKATDWCDHCRSGNRGRLDVFVLRHDDGRHVQVGRSCIADFLGHGDAQQMVWLAAAIRELRDLMGEMELGGGGARGSFWLEDEVLPFAAAAIRVDGWVPRSAAGEGRSATASNVQALVHGPGKNPKPAEVQWHKERQPTDADVAVAAAALEWARALPEDSDNDYLYNLRTMAGLGYIDARGFGLGVSIVSAYQRHLGQEIIRKRQAETSQWFGQPKKRADYMLTVTKAIGIDTAFGTATIYLMVDAAGNVAKWKSTAASLEIGKTYNIRATVKEHATYNGVAQTVLTNGDVKGEQVISQAAA